MLNPNHIVLKDLNGAEPSEADKGTGGNSAGDTESLDATVVFFLLTNVRLLDSPVSPAVDINRRYLLAHDPDPRLAPFRRAAGMAPQARPYGNRQSGGLDGHSAGHYLSALALAALLLVGLSGTAIAQQLRSPRYLATHMYTADPSARVFAEKLFIYPSHDIESNVPDRGGADKFDMKDYHVLSMDSIDGKVTDYGVALALEEVPWASRQMWAPDCAFKDGKYYLYFPAKDHEDVFRIGVAVGDSPEGPFISTREPIAGSYSIDPCVLGDDDGDYYLYFGGLWGGQLENYRDNQPVKPGHEPADDEPALCAKVARLSDSMTAFAEPPRDVRILDEEGQPLRAGDHLRRFFEAAWMHKYRGKYYFSYSTGDTHRLCYAVGDNPYGPFTYRGVILTPVVGWTTHHSITEFRGNWYLFYHDSRLSDATTHLRNIKVVPLEYDPDGNIKTIEGDR